MMTRRRTGLFTLPGGKWVSPLRALATIVWLLLFCAVLLAWALSYDWAAYEVYDRDSQTEWLLYRGALIQFQGFTYLPPPTERFRIRKTAAYNVLQGGRIVVRMWALATVLVLLGPGSLWLLRRYRLRKRLRRQRMGLCVQCGYDLRGLKEPRCPECNTPFDRQRLQDAV